MSIDLVAFAIAVLLYFVQSELGRIRKLLEGAANGESNSKNPQ